MVVMFGIILVLLYAASAYLFVYLKRQGEKVKMGTYSIGTESDELAKPVKAANVALKNLNGETTTLFDGKQRSQILAFVSESCIHCDNHLETIMYEIENSKGGPNHLTVILDKAYEKYGHKLSFRYGHLLRVLLGDQETFNQFETKFHPAFTIINDNQFIIAITPVPETAIHFWKQFKMGA